MQPQFWHWWALGGVLAILEVVAPGFVLIWLGLAALLVGVMLLIWPTMGLAFQLLAYAAFSVLSVFAWFRWLRTSPAETDQPGLNRRAEQTVGRRAQVVEPIVNGRGRIKLGDSTWSVTGPDLPAGRLVEITGSAGTVLEVRPVADPPPTEPDGPQV